MAADRPAEGVLAAAAGGGVPGLLGLLLAMEAGVPVPVPSDLVMLLLGERVSAGALPLWLAVVALEVVALAGTAALFLAARGPGRALLARVGPRVGLTGPRLAAATGMVERRGWPAMAAGRTTPGLRTATVVATASAGIRAGRALPALVLGSSLFLQAHLLLGYFLGPAARELLDQARLPVLAAAAAALVAGAILLLPPPGWGGQRPGRGCLPGLPGPGAPRPGAASPRRFPTPRARYGPGAASPRQGAGRPSRSRRDAEGCGQPLRPPGRLG